jgi:hypothetical protein
MVSKPESKAEPKAEPKAKQQEPVTHSYRYVGPERAVVVVLDGTAYDFRKGETVNLPAKAGLEQRDDFEEV